MMSEGRNLIFQEHQLDEVDTNVAGRSKLTMCDESGYAGYCFYIAIKLI